MPRWTGLALLCVALSACQEAAQPIAEPREILDQLSTRVDAYHTTVSTLTTAAAIRSATVTYAADMHDLIDTLRHASGKSTSIGSLVTGYTLEDVNQAISQLQEGVDSYTVRVKHLELIAELKDASNEHQAAMNEMFEEMRGMLGQS